MEIPKRGYFLLDLTLIIALLVVLFFVYYSYKDYSCRLQGKTYRHFTCYKPIKLPPNYLTPPR